MSLNEQILERLHQLYQDLPIEYCGYVLTAIEDIEKMIYLDKGPDRGLL